MEKISRGLNARVFVPDNDGKREPRRVDGEEHTHSSHDERINFGKAVIWMLVARLIPCVRSAQIFDIPAANDGAGSGRCWPDATQRVPKLMWVISATKLVSGLRNTMYNYPRRGERGEMQGVTS
jgi:hypothetical protein